jgi:hypothetical protein
MNKRKVSSTEVKVKVIQQKKINKTSCHEFGLVNSTVQMIWTNRNKIISATEQNGLRINFKSLNEVISNKHCLGD